MVLKATISAFVVTLLGLLAMLLTQDADMNLVYGAFFVSPYFLLITLIYFHFNKLRKKLKVFDKPSIVFEGIYSFLYYFIFSILLPVLLFVGTLGDEYEHKIYADLGGVISEMFPLILILSIFLSLFSSIMFVWGLRSWTALILIFLGYILISVLVSIFSTVGREVREAERERRDQADNLKEGRFEWAGAMSNPTGYPVQLYKGIFIFPKDEDYEFTFSEGNTVNYHAKWGEAGAETYKSMMSLPKAIDVTWYSFSENAFYRFNDTIDYNKLLTLFKQPYVERRAASDVEEHYNRIIFGFAPGGGLVIWAGGSGYRQVEIGQYQAKKIDVDQKVSDSKEMVYGDLFNQEWRNKVLTDTTIIPLAIQMAKKNQPVPDDYWNKLRTAYIWNPKFVIAPEIRTYDVIFQYFNAERFAFDERTQNITVEKRGIPQHIYIKWYDKNKNRCAVNFEFDETDIFKKFKAFFDRDKNIKAEMEITVDTQNGRATAQLKNAEHQLLLMETKIIAYGEKF
ncbi:DUF2931 family protein [Sphingobacterium sp. GVS05A]|uniref:DUF2931 family protein n=1 Tax=Sphingobacterium sp. GVS05A TaxID=2862679 RepID=UPI001CC0469D|nr:DUF2931 family protein [Sphingobacterium sp. GVS05A]